MRTRTKLAAAVTALAGAAAAAGIVTGSAGAQAAPTFSPANFTHPQANPYFPLTRGLDLRYRGSEDGEHFRERVLVTDRTKVILGVRTTVVRDILRNADGSLAEKTFDWYAADNSRNVWYFGENTATFDANGNVESREGSWQAGVRGARAGTIMPANPRPTDAYRQEFWRGHAEDQAWIVQNNTFATTPLRSFDHVVRSFEWSRLEKPVVSLKLYAPNVGIVVERDMSGGTEVFKLVAIHRP